MTVRFDLTQGRITRLYNAGIASIQDLFKVAEALDLKVTVEIEAKAFVNPRSDDARALAAEEE